MIEHKIDNIKNHLEFLSYNVESLTADNGTRHLKAKSQGKPNLMIWFGDPKENRPYAIFTSTWNGVKKVETIQQLSYLNKINEGVLLSKAFFDSDDDTLVFRTSYTGDYDKKSFGDFFDVFIDEIKVAMSGDEFEKLFIDTSK